MKTKIVKPLLLAPLLFLTLNCAKTTFAAPKPITIATDRAVTTVVVTNASILQKRQPKTPDAVVRELYKAHTPEKSILGTKSRAPLDKFLDKNLADLIWKDLTTHTDEVGVIDFDPFYNAQDTDIKNLVVGRAKINGDKATVPVSFTNFKKKNLLTYSLVRQNGAWKISDVRYNAKDSLLGYFKEAAKEQSSNAHVDEDSFASVY